MIGDVNLFLLEPATMDEAEGVTGDSTTPAEGAGASSERDGPVSSPAAGTKTAEIMVMIAEPDARRRGFGRDAARLMMAFGALMTSRDQPSERPRVRAHV